MEPSKLVFNFLTAIVESGAPNAALRELIRNPCTQTLLGSCFGLHQPKPRQDLCCLKDNKQNLHIMPTFGILQQWPSLSGGSLLRHINQKSLGKTSDYFIFL